MLSQLMQGEHGLSREVAMPPEAQMDEYGKVHLDFELSCPGTDQLPAQPPTGHSFGPHFPVHCKDATISSNLHFVQGSL